MVHQNNQNDQLVPEANLESLKLGVANAIGMGNGIGVTDITAANYNDVIARQKDQIANQLGILPQVEQVGWENITSRDCGRIGGRMGGHLGGQMVREMIQRAETILTGRQ